MKFLADENFDNRIVRGLRRRLPDIDILRVQDLEIAGADDTTVLTWAMESQRILLTHDARTIPVHMYEMLAAGKSVAGVLIVGDALPIGPVIDDIVVIIEYSTIEDWRNQIQRLPL